MSTIIYNKEQKSERNSTYSLQNPYFAKIKKRYVLSKEGSSKKTFHVEIDLTGSGISFKEGDALAILPENPHLLVSELLQLLCATGSEIFVHEKTNQDFLLQEFLSKKANLLKPTVRLLELLYETTQESHLAKLLQEDAKALRKEYLENHDVITLLDQVRPKNLNLEAFCNSLSPQLPRFYSVASSLHAHPNEVHLLVSTFTYETQKTQRSGIGSHFLCSQAKENECLIPLYVQSNAKFHLPEDVNTPIIMVGPGTGVAAFRSFIQKRILDKSAKNWLFFGERNRSFDFYYEEEFKALETTGLLQIETAFSRDQEHKVYVQHLMLKHAKTIFNWIQDGAYFYVCGDAKQMAKDVHDALITIFQTEKNCSEDEAKHLVQALRKEKRYQADVY